MIGLAASSLWRCGVYLSLLVTRLVLALAVVLYLSELMSGIDAVHIFVRRVFIRAAFLLDETLSASFDSPPDGCA